ncbi:hypothetical protein JW935_04850 [candidate division KSB1 bacterium]|nr:hypothetical protein [candidate division KSB1 bacterium]
MIKKRPSKQVPALWAVSGIKRAMGYTTITCALSAILARRGYNVTALSPDTISKSNTGQVFLSRYFELEKLFSSASSSYISKLKLLVDKIEFMDLHNIDTRICQLIIDLGASISHDSLDVFLSADEPLIVLSPDQDAVNDLHIFTNACLLRLLEINFASHKQEISRFSKRISKQGNITDQVESFCRFAGIDILPILNGISMKLLINRCHPETGQKLYQKYLTKTAGQLKPRMVYLGVLPAHKQTAALFATLKQYFIQSLTDPRLEKFERCVAANMNRVQHLNSTARTKAGNY